MAKARPKTAYERKIDAHIPAAKKIADDETIANYPDLGLRVVGGASPEGAVKLSGLELEERKPYFGVIDYWNNRFHMAMNTLCREAGVR